MAFCDSFLGIILRLDGLFIGKVFYDMATAEVVIGYHTQNLQDPILIRWTNWHLSVALYTCTSSGTNRLGFLGDQCLEGGSLVTEKSELRAFVPTQRRSHCSKVFKCLCSKCKVPVNVNCSKTFHLELREIHLSQMSILLWEWKVFFF